ncbi:MAG: DUF3276 family protein [Treponema sp.]|jgi:hypothetical protein|nr:DUF3276 family protein [Treponema sp.]
MGVRGEIFSTKVQLKNRTYFFNVKENRMGDIYLNIVESKNQETGGFERQSIVLFGDDLQEFLGGFDQSLKVMEKSAKEKKKAVPRKPRTEDGDSDFKKRESSGSGNFNADGKKRYGRKTDGEQRPRGDREQRPRAGGRDSKPWDKDKKPFDKDRKPRPRAVRAVRRDDDKREE